MRNQKRPKGPWIHRFAIRFFSVILAILVYWVLGFLVEDIESIPGPEFEEIAKTFIDEALVEKEKVLKSEIAEVDRSIENKRDAMELVRNTSSNLQETIKQLIELQKLTVQKSVSLPEKEQATLSMSLSQFLNSQKQYQTHSTELSKLTDKKRTLESKELGIKKAIEAQRKPAREEYKKLNDKHDLRLAFLQLFILLPLLAVGVFSFVKKRNSIYYPIFFGYGAATLLKVSLVVHNYFPTRYFKYVLTLGLLAAVAKLLIYFIRVVAFPKAHWLSRQYREAYERFLCPICEYPIRTGPRRYLFWTRRTVKKLVFSNNMQGDEAYTCPACGTALFEECSACHKVRHALLPHCQHCNAEKHLDTSLDESNAAVK